MDLKSVLLDNQCLACRLSYMDLENALLDNQCLACRLSHMDLKSALLDNQCLACRLPYMDLKSALLDNHCLMRTEFTNELFSVIYAISVASYLDLLFIRGESNKTDNQTMS